METRNMKNKRENKDSLDNPHNLTSKDKNKNKKNK